MWVARASPPRGPGLSLKSHPPAPGRVVADALIEELSRGDSLFLVHQSADPDAIGSAFALARAFGGRIGESAGLAASARRLAERVGADIDPMPHFHKYARVVLVDTSSLTGLGPYASKMRPEDALMIDHHAYGDLAARARVAWVDGSRASCAEVVLGVLDRAGRPPDADAAFALAVGIVADSARFRHGGLDPVRAFLRLAEPHGFSVADCFAVLDDEEPGDDLPRRVANVRAASRASVDVLDRLVVTVSHVSAFEASAAAGLVRLGADLAVVSSEKGGRGRVSARGSHTLLGRGVHLGQVANAVALETAGWGGGGHEGAAGLNGPRPAARVAEAVAAAALARARAPQGVA